MHFPIWWAMLTCKRSRTETEWEQIQRQHANLSCGVNPSITPCTPRSAQAAEHKRRKIHSSETMVFDHNVMAQEVRQLRIDMQAKNLELAEILKLTKTLYDDVITMKRILHVGDNQHDCSYIG